jgi:hypothetical protein
MKKNKNIWITKSKFKKNFLNNSFLIIGLIVRRLNGRVEGRDKT